MIRIEVRLYATLQKYVPDAPAGSPLPVTLREGTSLGELLATFGIPPSAVQLVFVNGVARGLEHPLRNADRVALFPPVGGG